MNRLFMDRISIERKGDEGRKRHKERMQHLTECFKLQRETTTKQTEIINGIYWLA